MIFTFIYNPYHIFIHSGLSGSTAAEIQAVDANFIQEAQIGQSLTPGRNNGFLNMLAAMKNKAGEIAASAASGGNSSAAAAEEEEIDGLDLSGDRPMYNGMVKALSLLKPTVLDLVDNSDQHAGHEGSKGFNGESHFDLYIVADAFDGLNLVKRHKLVYMLLGEIMPKIHALQISAKTPAEVQ
jgi:BolA protein